MKNLFEPTTAAEIITRLEKIQPAAQPQWGKMNAAQMMAHCQATFEVYFGGLKPKRNLMGIFFGKMAMKRLISNKPWPKSLPTAKEFIIANERDFQIERTKLVQAISQFSNTGQTVKYFVHPFFGKVTSGVWGKFSYRHLDHHLLQFGV
jgi:hypothetical protein